MWLHILVGPCWGVYVAVFWSRLYSQFFFDNIKIYSMYVKVKNMFRKHINNVTLNSYSC